jgi:hypothetical protein
MKHYLVLSFLIIVFAGAGVAFAQKTTETESPETAFFEGEAATGTATSASSTDEMGATLPNILSLEKTDVTVPEQPSEKEVILQLLEERPVTEPGVLSFMAFWVQESIRLGIPANTIILILLVPILATVVTFVRLIIGLPSLEMLVPIILSFSLVALGLTTGLMVLAAIVAASFMSRIALRKVSIMHLPKRSISLFFLSLFVFAVLSISVSFDLGDVSNVSIFPVLILILLGDKIVSVQLHKSIKETVLITFVTVMLGVFGYVLSVFTPIRNFIVLYPEIIFFAVFLNILMGRYFGMRLTELFRFKALQPQHGSE